MNCSEINFVQSQHFYGLCIAKRAELPSLQDGDRKWIVAIDRILALSNISAQRQIDSNNQPKFTEKVVGGKWSFTKIGKKIDPYVQVLNDAIPPGAEESWLKDLGDSSSWIGKKRKAKHAVS
jgi:hypothetical protein